MILDGVDARERASARRCCSTSSACRPPGDTATGGCRGGEQQRVAVAVALANQPPVLLADEPTGELDGATAAEILRALRRVNAELRTTIVIVTHDPLVRDQVQRTVAIRDGRTSTETVHAGAERAGDRRAIAGGDAKARRRRRRGVRGARPGRPAAAAARPRRGARARRRVRLRLEDDHVGVWPDRAPASAGRAARQPARRHAGRAPRTRPTPARPDRQTPEPPRAIPRGRRSDELTRPLTRGPAAGPGWSRRRRDREFPSGTACVHALRGVDLPVAAGELVAVSGRSGAGKTTLLNVLGGLDRPTRRSGRRRRRGGHRDGRGRARPPPARDGRLHLPGVRARPDPVRRGERGGAAPARGTEPDERAPRRRSCSSWSAWASAPGTGRTSCRAASSSGSPSPGRSPTGRGSCWPTSRPASSTRRPGTRSWTCSARSSRRRA